MSEGSLEAPTRHPIAWQDESFYDPAEIEKELRRVFDICHGCRRCFNLCDSFPRLFDLVDSSPTQEMDGVDSKDFKSVVDVCTLCDMCYMTKCPYVPPHPFNVDFPHLMLRHRAMEEKQGKVSFVDKQLAATDRNGALASVVAPIANWATARDNKTVGPMVRKVADFHPDAELPKYASKTLVAQAEVGARGEPGRAGVRPQGRDLRDVFRQLQQSPCRDGFVRGAGAQRRRDRDRAAALLRHAAAGARPYRRCRRQRAPRRGRAMGPWIDKGYDVIALVPSCALMLKLEWRLILPDDPAVAKLARATFDISEYIVDIAKKEGMAPGLTPVPGTLSVHMACHARAQNMGQKAAEMLRLIPEADVKVIERCSGHGGSWGFKKEYFDIAMKVGRPVARQAAENGAGFVMSECPLAGVHIAQGMEKQTANRRNPNWFRIRCRCSHDPMVSTH